MSKYKITKTYSIDKDLYIEFLNIVYIDKINQSKLIESFIQEYVNKNKDKK